MRTPPKSANGWAQETSRLSSIADTASLMAHAAKECLCPSLLRLNCWWVRSWGYSTADRRPFGQHEPITPREAIRPAWRTAVSCLRRAARRDGHHDHPAWLAAVAAFREVF